MHIFFELRFIRSKSLNRFIVKLVLNEIGAIVFIALFRTRFLTPIPWLASSHHPFPPPPLPPHSTPFWNFRMRMDFMHLKFQELKNAKLIIGLTDSFSFQEPHDCNSYNQSVCTNATTAAMDLGLVLTKCDTDCNSAAPPTSASTMESSTGTAATVEATTATAQVFRPDLIGMLIVLMAVIFGLQ